MDKDKLRLGDGAPVWLGAAVRTGMCPGPMLIVTSITDDGEVSTDSERGGMFAIPAEEYDEIDLSHRPTFLELAMRVVDMTPTRSWCIDQEGLHEFIDGAGEVLVAGFDAPSALLDLWRQVDGQGVGHG